MYATTLTSYTSLLLYLFYGGVGGRKESVMTNQHGLLSAFTTKHAGKSVQKNDEFFSPESSRESRKLHDKCRTGRF